MKRILFALLILAFPCMCFGAGELIDPPCEECWEPVQLARMTTAAVAGGACGDTVDCSACNTGTDSCKYGDCDLTPATATTERIYDECDSSSASSGVAQTFSITSAICISSYQIRVKVNNGGETGTLYAQLYTDNAGTPGSAVSGTIAQTSIDALGGTYTTPELQLSAPYHLTSTGTYHVVFWADAASNLDVSTYFIVFSSDDDSTGASKWTSNGSCPPNNANWSSAGTEGLNVIILGCDPS